MSAPSMWATAHHRPEWASKQCHIALKSGVSASRFPCCEFLMFNSRCGGGCADLPLEHFLHGALQNYYSMSSEQASETLSHLEIFHPYGTVGPLPWKEPQRGIDYGGEPYSQQLNSLATQIRTFTEGTDETASEIVAIRSTLRTAQRAAFLGFAFHPLNLELLYGAKKTKATVHDGLVYATAFGLSTSDARLIANDLEFQGGYLPDNVSLNQNLTASQLFNEYSRSLSLQ